MKKSLLFSIAIFGTLGLVSCEKCADCSTNVDNNYRFNSGEVLTVTSGTCIYGANKKNYTTGQSFTIQIDSSLFENGLRFEGNGKVEIKNEICAKGHAFKNQKDAYTKNGWGCSDK